jgi:DNA-binding response OmpR family regulator
VTDASGRATILVVDDDEGVTETFARALRLEGYVVRTASDAATGLREASSCGADAILVDLRMPLMDGLGFLQRLRQQDPGRSTPVAVVTGDYFVDDEIATELEGLGATLRFKPIWLEDVVKLTHKLVTGPPFTAAGSSTA